MWDHLQRDLAGVDGERDLFPHHLPYPVVRQDGVGAHVGHPGGGEDEAVVLLALHHALVVLHVLATVLPENVGERVALEPDS